MSKEIKAALFRSLDSDSNVSSVIIQVADCLNEHVSLLKEGKITAEKFCKMYDKAMAFYLYSNAIYDVNYKTTSAVGFNELKKCLDHCDSLYQSARIMSAALKGV